MLTRVLEVHCRNARLIPGHRQSPPIPWTSSWPHRWRAGSRTSGLAMALLDTVSIRRCHRPGRLPGAARNVRANPSSP